MHPMLNIGIRAARAAGKVITQNMDRVDTLNVSRKAHNDFVSDVDRMAEAAVIAVLRKAYPDHAILGEESGAHGAAEAEFQWIVDPLDGTINFLHGFPHFNVSIALRHKGRLDQAVIYNPVSQELFTASRGAGAWLNNKRIRVSRENYLENTLIGSGFPGREGDDLEGYVRQFAAVSARCRGIRRPGAAALDLAFVAAGRLDGFWVTGVNEWDLAAGALIIREAGGIVTDITGGDQWAETGSMVAGNPKITHALLQTLAATKTATNS